MTGKRRRGCAGVLAARMTPRREIKARQSGSRLAGIRWQQVDDTTGECVRERVKRAERRVGQGANLALQQLDVVAAQSCGVREALLGKPRIQSAPAESAGHRLLTPGPGVCHEGEDRGEAR